MFFNRLMPYNETDLNEMAIAHYKTAGYDYIVR